jgi:hypothetical protein
VLRPFGDMVAVGRPGEDLPVPGAVRLYAEDSQWQSVVREQMRAARLVVVRAGIGKGLLWEIGEALTRLPPERLLFLILDLPIAEYRAFAEQVAYSFKIALPAVPPCGLIGYFAAYRQKPSSAAPGFVVFSANGRASFLRLPFTLGQTGFNDLKKPFNLALRPVFERHGVPWRSVGRFH